MSSQGFRKFENSRREELQQGWRKGSFCEQAARLRIILMCQFEILRRSVVQISRGTREQGKLVAFLDDDAPSCDMNDMSFGEDEETRYQSDPIQIRWRELKSLEDRAGKKFAKRRPAETHAEEKNRH